MSALLQLQAMKSSGAEIDPRGSGLSFFCDGDNSAASLWCGGHHKGRGPQGFNRPCGPLTYLLI